MFHVIAFDADDTLWHNESVFQATEKQFSEFPFLGHAGTRNVEF